jgi:hypothetical protein
VVFVIAVELHALLVLVVVEAAVVVGVEAVVAQMQEEAAVLVLLLLLVVHLDCLAQMIGRVQCKRLRLKFFCFVDLDI